MTRSRIACRLLATALLGFVTLGSMGCLGLIYTDLRNTTLKVAKYRIVEGDKKSPKGQYARFQGKKKNVDRNERLGFARFGYEAFSPFHYSLTTGSFDPKRRNLMTGQTACTEVDVAGTGVAPPTIRFATLCATKAQSGWDVFAAHNWDGTFAQEAPTHFTESDLMDLQVTTDDDGGGDPNQTLRLSARLPQDLIWTPIRDFASSEHGYDLTTQSLIPSIGANFLNNKGEIGFNNYAGASSPRPNPDPFEEVYDYAFRGIKYAIVACTLMEIFLPVALDIETQILAAEANFDLALAAMEAQFADNRARRRAEKQMAKAKKAGAKARQKVASGKYNAAAGQLKKMVKAGEKAAVPFQPAVLKAPN
jgi:hypothetical protein